MHASTRLFSTVSALSLAALAGCSDATGTGGMRSVSLSFSTLPPAGPSASVASFSLSATVSPIVITKAQLVISKSELARSSASCTSTTTTDEQECPELKLGPMLVDLPLDANAKGVLAVDLPAGTYQQFEAKIDAVMNETEGDPAASAAFLAANPSFRGVSVRVEGTYDGQPFVYTTAAEGELELTFNPPLVVDAPSSNLTVNVDLSSWFRRSDGTTIDPRTATAGSATKEIVDDNIKRSFDVFEDENRDGRED